jgi:hypothetical protein
MSSRRHRCSTPGEWFIKEWYVADNDRHVTAVNMKMEKAIKSAAVTPEYRLVRYRRICHSSSRKNIAGMRWEYMLTDSLWIYAQLQNEA